MKVSKDGTIKLSSNEIRIGNFVVALEEGHVKVMDINRTVTHRVSRNAAIGRFLEILYDRIPSDESARRSLGNYIAVLWSFSAVVPDVEFLADVHGASVRCIERHAEAYGVKGGPQTEADDAEALRAVKEEAELAERVKEMDTGAAE